MQFGRQFWRYIFTIFNSSDRICVCASGSVGGVRPCQGRGRGFESRLALFFILEVLFLQGFLFIQGTSSPRMIHWWNIRISRFWLFLISIRIPRLMLMLMGWHYLRYINIFVINARKQRLIKCLDKHNFCSFLIMDLHSFMIYHLIKLFLKLNRVPGVNSSFCQNW